MAPAGNRRIDALSGSLSALAWLQLAACYDLYPCRERPTYTELSCPFGTAVACWSLDRSVAWVCWSSGMVPQWLSGPLPGTPASVGCSAWPTPPGSQRASYDGACTMETPTREKAVPTPPTPLTWDEADVKADETLGMMTDAEMHSLMNGVGWAFPKGGGWWDLKKWWYVGNTPAIPRLGIPSLNMQDSAGGFRPYWHELVGTVTCWPSQLALTATWDADLVKVFAMAVGLEFKGKGANVILGPSVNVHRIARGGRNFEYISGEDPYLGTRLVPSWVEGVQSQGVLAVVKHWIFNEQETHRDTEDSVVDEKTSWELYYPPFDAAVKAGVGAAMCSYNLENGKHSCANPEQLKVLKQDMGFHGFVQSDWWALHSMGLTSGTDQDMPGIGDDKIGMKPDCMPPGCVNTSSWFMPSLLETAPREAVHDAVKRILAAIYHLKLGSVCSPPNCTDWFKRNVTSASNVALARYISAESIILLKNEGDLLPLPSDTSGKVKSIAIVGRAAVAKPFDPNGVGQGGGVWNKGDYYSGGGSGHITASEASVITPMAGISARAKQAGLEVFDGSESTDAALAAAGKADVTIVVGATTGQEAADRANLDLDDGVNELILALTKVTGRLVVLMQLPGVVLTPWRGDVQAILAMFLGGQTTGDAWGDVLFGDHAPGGRLPVMMPATEADTIPPGNAVSVPYSEGLRTSYRNEGFKAAFPFGHGLTYTSFKYTRAKLVSCQNALFDPNHWQKAWLETQSEQESAGSPDNAGGSNLCLTMSVKNIGEKAAKDTPQLYLEFPPEAGHPAPFLKGFQRTAVLLPGHSQEVMFQLTDRDMSYYDVHQHNWVRASSVTAHIGASSEKIDQSLKLDASGPETGRTLWIVLFSLLTLGLTLASVMVLWPSRRKSKLSDEGQAFCGDDEETSTEDSSCDDGRGFHA